VKVPLELVLSLSRYFGVNLLRYYPCCNRRRLREASELGEILVVQGLHLRHGRSEAFIDRIVEQKACR
jgi:hypothetical protein